MNIIDDLLVFRDRIDAVIKAAEEIGLRPTAQEKKSEIPIHPDLSAREYEILKLLGEESDTRVIAEKLGISKKTVESTRDNIRKKLGVENSYELRRMVKEGRI